MERAAWVVAGIDRQMPAKGVWKLMGLLADNSAGAVWKADHGLIKTAFRLDDVDPDVAERRAVEKFEGIARGAGLESDSLEVLTCVISPPSPHVGWEWPAELS
jgi:hypothetical protein